MLKADITTRQPVSGDGFGRDVFRYPRFPVSPNHCVRQPLKGMSTDKTSKIIRDEDYYLQNAIFQVRGRT